MSDKGQIQPVGLGGRFQ